MSEEPFEGLLEAMRLSALTKVVTDLLILKHELSFGQAIAVLLNATATVIASSTMSEGDLNESLQEIFEQPEKLTLEYMGKVRNIKKEKKQ